MICLKSFFCIFAIELKNGLWCNGNTTDSGSVIPSSSLGSLTFFFFLRKSLVEEKKHLSLQPQKEMAR